jgi:Phytanoyl-CoA dioxygenase (PhyH)
VLTLQHDGAELVRKALSSEDVLLLDPMFEKLSATNAGARVTVNSINHLRPLKIIKDLVGNRLSPAARPVRALLFDKHEGNNWALGWHQDRTIAVKQRKDVEGFGPWTIKAGALHVAPPIELLAKMVTVRVHLDSVDEENAPLLIAPGSHRRGLINERDIDTVVAECGQQVCLANTGDVWLYATPILHASARAANPRHRRVLQIDYSADDLPSGLEWAADA